MRDASLGQIAATFASLSVVAIGGANAVMPEIHRQVVDGLGWMDGQTFARLFAIAQAAPGPNVMIVSLIGWNLAGFAGLVVATAAMLLPSGILAFTAGRVFTRAAGTVWLATVKAGLVPISIGLIAASGLVMARAAADDRLAILLTAGATLYTVQSNRNPLWVLSAGSLISVAVLWVGP